MNKETIEIGLVKNESTIMTQKRTLKSPGIQEFFVVATWPHGL